MNHLLSLAALCYLAGSFLPAAYFYRGFAADIFRAGSGSPGTMNALELMGWPYATLTLFYDFGKGFLPILYCHSQHVDLVPAIAIGTFATMGHCFSAYYGLRGGKGVAPTAGILVGSMLYVGFWQPFIALLLGLAEFGVFYWVCGNVERRREISISLMVGAAWVVVNISHISLVLHGETTFLAALIIGMVWQRAEPAKATSSG